MKHVHQNMTCSPLFLFPKFDHLDIQGENTDMSLSISLDAGKVEWSSHSLTGLFATPANLLSPKFHAFLRDLLHFNSHAGKILLLPPQHPYRMVTIGEYLIREGYGEEFGRYYLIPMMAALWSASVEDVWMFPAVSLVEFMCNHR
jgi:cyclopropane-fatty-acyl-phospholipid synthase